MHIRLPAFTLPERPFPGSQMARSWVLASSRGHVAREAAVDQAPAAVADALSGIRADTWSIQDRRGSVCLSPRSSGYGARLEGGRAPSARFGASMTVIPRAGEGSRAMRFLYANIMKKGFTPLSFGAVRSQLHAAGILRASRALVEPGEWHCARSARRRYSNISLSLVTGGSARPLLPLTARPACIG
jgi:hypothetical protein